MSAQMEHQLLIGEGGSRPRVIMLPQGESLIGRDPGATVHLTSMDVSDHHARLACDSTGCHLTDLGSDAGTWMGRRRLEAGKPVKLGHGAVFRIGLYDLTYRQVQARQETQPPPEIQPGKKAAAKPHTEPKAGSPRKKPSTGPSDESLPAASPPRVPPPVDPSSPASVYRLNPSQPPPGLDFRSVKLINYLPGIYHTEFMERFLAVFEAMLLPIESTIDNFDLYLDPATAPSAFLPWLAGWFHLVFDDSWSDDRRRLLLAEAHLIYARRGTKYALSRLLEIYTGDKPEIIDTGVEQPPDTFTVRLPGSAERYHRFEIEKLIDLAKPAHTHYTLLFSPK